MSSTRPTAKKRPVLRGFVTWNRKHIAVYCPYCSQMHYHGWSPALPLGAVTHRVAHCVRKDSAFYDSGYWIGEFRASDVADWQVRFPFSRRPRFFTSSPRVLAD